MSVKLGNTEASLYLGSTPVAAYLGGEQVYSAATVPGAPTITLVDAFADLEFIAPENDGGSAILSYNIYVNGVLAANEQPFAPGFLPMSNTSAQSGDDVEIAAVNAIGEGPKSNVFVAE
jgi:hypothetical protein